MGRQGIGIVGFTLAALALHVLLPAVADGQSVGTGFTLQGTLGTHATAGGHAESVAFGLSDEGVALLVGAERIHVPVRRIGGGIRSNGTVTFGSIEARFGRTRPQRFSPYGLVGVGFGVSRPNSAGGRFGRRINNPAKLLIFGAGLNRNLRARLTLIADARVAFMAEKDIIAVLLPVRVGLCWRIGTRLVRAQAALGATHPWLTWGGCPPCSDGQNSRTRKAIAELKTSGSLPRLLERISRSLHRRQTQSPEIEERDQR
jgi:hypothetical protein